MHSQFMAVWVGQFSTGHFSTIVYLHRFGHLAFPLCEGCGVPDIRAHLLLDSSRWMYHHERLWVGVTECERIRYSGGRDLPHLGLGFPRGTAGGRLWLGYFLVAIKPRQTCRIRFSPGPMIVTERGIEDKGFGVWALGIRVFLFSCDLG